MAKLSLKMRNQYVDKDGKAKICINLSHQTKTVIVKSLISIRPKDWDKKKCKIKSTAQSYLEYTKENIAIHRELQKYESILNELNIQKTLQVYNVAQIREMLLKEDKKAVMDIFQLFQDYIDHLENIKTKQGYVNTLQHLQNHLNNDYMPIESLSSSFLENFEQYLKREKGQAVNTISIHMRNIRTICNYAIRKDIMDYKNYPFRNYKIKNQKTRHRTIDVKDIKKLLNYDGNMSENKARDLFMLSFYLIGINFKDLLYIQKSDVYNNRINYIRHKTLKPISVLIQPEAEAIINKYEGDKHILHILELKRMKAIKAEKERSTPLHEDVISQTNRNLKKIFTKLGINIPISTYYARHSWATIARKIGIDYDIIQQALAHSNNQVTSIYIEYDEDAIDQANRKVIDYLISQ